MSDKNYQNNYHITVIFAFHSFRACVQVGFILFFYRLEPTLSVFSGVAGACVCAMGERTLCVERKKEARENAKANANLRLIMMRVNVSEAGIGCAIDFYCGFLAAAVVLRRDANCAFLLSRRGQRNKFCGKHIRVRSIRVGVRGKRQGLGGEG